MLNLPIAMLTFLRVLFLVVAGFTLIWAPVLAADAPPVSFPLAGEALQGMVIINGSTDVVGFVSAEISFNYTSGVTESWFLIQQSSKAVKDGPLAVWDTTTIADGTYRLRVRVHLGDGTKVETIIPDLRVRNYTPIETKTPVPMPKQGSAPTPTAPLPSVTPRFTPTSLPPNPLIISPLDLTFGAIQGAVLAIISLGLLAIYRWVKRR